jgi:hypothetical protein
MFTNLYLITTNPNLSLPELFEPKVLGKIIFSAIFHTLVYTLFFNLVSYIFFGKFLSRVINIRLLISVFIIMLVGFLGRFLHVKDIYKSYHYDLEKTRNYVDKHYITWLFIS